MTLLQALILGIVQGLTEFLPVSSSGHLLLAEHLLGLRIAPEDLQAINIFLHAGTLLALIIVYATTWWELITKRMTIVVLLVLATIPAAFAGVLFEDVIARIFSSPLLVGIALSVTGVVLLLGEYYHRKERAVLSPRAAFLVGCAQACALVPGLSRSGLTISAARVMGLKRKEALDFSFLMAMPIIAGAVVLSLKDLFDGTLLLPAPSVLWVAVGTSFVVSMVAVLFLRAFVVRRSLAWFAPYLFITAAIAIGFSL